MIIVHHIDELAAHGITRITLTCGVFDGLHRGHRHLLQATLDAAARLGAAPAVMTFDPPPQTVLNPNSPKKLLYSLEHRLMLMERMHFRAAVVQPFTNALAGLSPRSFLEDLILQPGLELACICAGSNWRFGRGALGDVAFLRKTGTEMGFAVDEVEGVLVGGGPVSSTRVREAVQSGDLDAAAELLGRAYSVLGRVHKGKGIAGPELDTPTANLDTGSEITPPTGIYAARARVIGRTDEYISGIVYLGTSPTFVEDTARTPVLEIHLFDFQDDLYEQQLEVEFVQFIRQDMKFESAADLACKIAEDIDKARAALA